MNPPWQPPDPKRFRPNDPQTDRPWIPPPHHSRNPVPPHQPHVHPSRQSQLPPPPPIAPYHQPPPPAPAPYYPPPHNAPPPVHNPNPGPYPPPTYYPPHSIPPPHTSSHSRRNKSSDPRQRHNHPHGHPTYPPMHPNMHNHNSTMTPLPLIDTHNSDNKSDATLDVLHIASDETKNFGSFAVTLSQIYGSRNMDGLPFGGNSNDSIEFDGRIRNQPILSFLPEAIDTPSKKVRVYELSPLASTDKRSYDELVAFFTKNERCPVVDKEYNMGILLYFVPPKLIFKKVDPLKGQKIAKKNKKKRGKTHKTNFVELLKLNGNGKVNDDRLWMISITSTSKYLLFKQKLKDKINGKKESKKEGKNKNKRKRDESELSDIEISSDDDESGKEDMDDSDDGMDGMGKKNKGDDIVKSDLIIALEELYGKIGQKLPE
eukprot:1001159_1